MAKVLCAISGIEFTCDHMSISLYSREYSHPIFYLSQKKLLGLYQKYRHGELNDTDSYLLFLAYLNSTDLIEWRVPVQRTPQTTQIIANNFDLLVACIERINRIKNPSIQFSHIAVTSDTKNLANVHYWLAAWESTYDDFVSGYASQKHKQALADIEEKLEYLIKDANRNDTQFASRLAVWAEKAGAFPRFSITLNGTSVTCAEYWKQIIRKCVNQESIFMIPESDLVELLEHCETNIDAGSIYAYHLFKILKEGREKQNSFLGLGNFSFSIISQDSSTEEANKLAIISTAPDSAPRRIDYPSQFAYIKAKLAYDMKQSKEEAETAEELKRKDILDETTATTASEESEESDYEHDL